MIVNRDFTIAYLQKGKHWFEAQIRQYLQNINFLPLHSSRWVLYKDSVWKFTSNKHQSLWKSSGMLVFIAHIHTHLHMREFMRLRVRMCMFFSSFCRQLWGSPLISILVEVLRDRSIFAVKSRWLVKCSPILLLAQLLKYQYHLINHGLHTQRRQAYSKPYGKPNASLSQTSINSCISSYIHV